MRPPMPGAAAGRVQFRSPPLNGVKGTHPENGPPSVFPNESQLQPCRYKPLPMPLKPSREIWPSTQQLKEPDKMAAKP